MCRWALDVHLCKGSEMDIARFPPPWPRALEALGYAAEPAKLAGRKKLPLFGMLKKRVSAGEICAAIDTLAPLVHMLKLEEIDLCGAPRVTDLAPLAGLDHLKSIVMWKTGIASLEPLRGKTSLRELHVWCTPIESVEALAETPDLAELSVEYTRVASLEPLAGLRKLRTLDISGTMVRSLAPLSAVPLTRLIANRTTLEATELRAFRKTHPGCVIERSPSYPERSTRCGC